MPYWNLRASVRHFLRPSTKHHGKKRLTYIRCPSSYISSAVKKRLRTRCPSDIFLAVKERLCLIATCTHRAVHHTFPLPSKKYCVLRRSSCIYFLCRLKKNLCLAGTSVHCAIHQTFPLPSTKYHCKKRPHTFHLSSKKYTTYYVLHQTFPCRKRKI